MDKIFAIVCKILYLQFLSGSGGVSSIHTWNSWIKECTVLLILYQFSPVLEGNNWLGWRRHDLLHEIINLSCISEGINLWSLQVQASLSLIELLLLSLQAFSVCLRSTSLCLTAIVGTWIPLSKKPHSCSWSRILTVDSSHCILLGGTTSRERNYLKCLLASS